MTVACLIIGYIAYTSVTAEQIAKAVPAGWKDLWFGSHLHLDWSKTPYPGVNGRIASDGFELFGALFGMMVFKGIFASLAGPVPSYDMQRVLSTRTPAEAAKMSMSTILVLYIPRYLMVASFAVLGLVYLQPQLSAMGNHPDFEKVLPLSISRFVPVGLKGLLLAGLLASFMGTFAAFVNAAPAYIVNDVYKKYINPHATDKKYIRLSILSSLILVVAGILFGFKAASLNELTLWITSALYGGYAASNMLKWIWWRFTGYGYFWGMLAGLLASTAILLFKPSLLSLLNDTGLFHITGAMPDIFLFPLVLLCSMAGCIAGTLARPLENREQVKTFYRETRPWGWWGPIKAEVMAEDPAFRPNRAFRRDLLNVVTGIVWQMSQVVLPIYFMIRENYKALVWAGIFLLTSWMLKKYWWNHLKNDLCE
jgi:hypothetical protein